MSETAHQTVKNSKDELFKYTSGRWMYVFLQQATALRLTHYSYNEPLRLAERYLQFDIPALIKVVAAASGHGTSDIVSFYKMAEGGFNRLFQATFTDGRHVIARLLYPSTAPEHYTVASEAATLDYLRLHGIPTPQVYAWCSTKANPVGADILSWRD